MKRELWFIGIAWAVVTLSGYVRADESRTVDPIIAQQAELKLLRQTVERQNGEIAALKSQVKLLSDRLEALGVAANTEPATQEAQGAPKSAKRIVFLKISGSQEIRDEIIRAVDGLQPGQFFNVLTPMGQKVEPYAPNLIEATPRNKAKYHADAMKASTWTYWTDLGVVLNTALKGDPEVLWLVGGLGSSDEEADMKLFKRAYAGRHTRINTTAGFGWPTPTGRHYLWRIAHETGGICIDASGQPIDEPAVPIRVEVPKEPEKPRPSILKP